MGKKFNLDESFRRGAERYKFEPTTEDWLHAQQLIEQHQLYQKKAWWQWNSFRFLASGVLLAGVLLSLLWWNYPSPEDQKLFSKDEIADKGFERILQSTLPIHSENIASQPLRDVSRHEAGPNNDQTAPSTSQDMVAITNIKNLARSGNTVKDQGSNTGKEKELASKQPGGPSTPGDENKPQEATPAPQEIIPVNDRALSIGQANLSKLPLLHLTSDNSTLQLGYSHLPVINDSIVRQSRKEYLVTLWGFYGYSGVQLVPSKGQEEGKAIPVLQIGVNYRIHPRLSVGVGTGYFTSGLTGAARETDSTFYDFGIEHFQYHLRIEKLHYLQSIVELMVHLSAHHQINLSAEPSYLIAAQGTIEKNRFASFGEFETETTHFSGKTDGLNPLHLQLGIGYQYRMSDFLSLSAGYKWQVSDVFDDGLFGDRGNIDFSGFSIGLKYAIH